jgi:hypothetical protein
MKPNKQKMELTWTVKENNDRFQPHIRIEFAEDPQQDNSPVHCHEASLGICHEPRCGCLNILVQWLPGPGNAQAASAHPAREFWYNLNEKSVALPPELKQEPEMLRLAEIFRAELTEADRQQLREWYLARKLVCIQTTPPSEIDITGLPVVGGGAMIGFVDVFPCGLALNFTWNDEVWSVDEQYCVEPCCECTETILSFLKLRDAAGRVTTEISDPPAIRYNYHSQASRPVTTGRAGSPALNDLLTALQHGHPNLNDQLKLRHLIMQSLYARHYLEQVRSLSQSAGMPSAMRHKVGRNEPCPCGSGRKYKHCCLNK